MHASDPARRHGIRDAARAVPDHPRRARRRTPCWRGSSRCCRMRLPAISQQARDRAPASAQADALRALCAMPAFRFIVNDDAALAAAVGADGVHLGEHDGAIAAARALLGNDAIIGVSCYDDIERARVAAGTGADYLAFGAFFHRDQARARRASTGPARARHARSACRWWRSAA